MAREREKQRSAQRRLKHHIEYALLRSLLFVLRLLPIAGALWVARRLGDFTFDVIRIRREVTLRNIEETLGATLSARERIRIARASYRNAASTFIEFGLFPHWGIKALRERIKMGPVRTMREAAKYERGILYLTAHVGNWEMLGAAMAWLDGPIYVVAGTQRNHMVNRYITHLRESFEMRVLEVGSALKEVMRKLRQNERVALVADQDAGPTGLFIEFLGRPASIAIGPARFAYRTGAPIVIGLDRRVDNGHHETRLYPPIVADRSRPEAEETKRIMGIYARILEDFIRQYPDQWFWMHRRWKTKPPGHMSHQASLRGGAGDSAL